MAKYFLKLSGSNDIEGIIEWDGVSSYTPPPGYTLELVTTTASINYNPSSSLYTDPVFGGKLFGEFSGELTGSITINGKTIDDILNETPYGTLTLYSSSMKNISVKSGSFKINNSSSLFLPLVNNNTEYYQNYSSSLEFLSKNSKNKKIILSSKENRYDKLIFSLLNTEITSSVSASVSNDFYILNINEDYSYFKSANTEIKIKDYFKFTDELKDYYGNEWYINFEYEDNPIILNSEKSTKYGKVRYNGYSENINPGSGYFSINSSTAWSEATELYLSIDNYEKNTEVSSSKSSLYSSTINNLFYEKILGSKIKLESDVDGDNTYKIFEVQDVLLITGSENNYAKIKVTEKDSYTSGYVLLAIGQKFNIDFELLNKNKRQVDIITESKTFKPPYWAKEIIVMSIGSGGGGGGGVDAKLNHSFAVGGAGGSGGSISYSHFKELSGSIKIDCFVGTPGRGGNTGSSALTQSYGNLCTTCSFESILPFYEKFNIVDTIPTILSQSNVTLFEILDDSVPTGSNGISGNSTIAYIYNTDFISNQSDLLGIVSAPGGIGGSGGYSIGFTGSLTSSLVNDLIVSNSLFPVSIPGGTNLNLEQSMGEHTFYGSPGGHGISLNISDENKSKNNAPSLPWGTDDTLDLEFPFGRNSQTSKRIDFDYDINSVVIGKYFLPYKSATVIPITSTNLNKNYLQFNYDKPSNYAPTGGGGATGWVNSNIVVTSSMSLGISGKLNSQNSIFEYPISIGGNGGNNSILGNLQIVMPESGSGPGAGGGGGSSNYTNGSTQKGADGGPGVVVVISIG